MQTVSLRASSSVRSNGLLLLAALIWGFAFVAQRIGAQYLGPLAFNGLRFLLGAISLFLMVLYTHKAQQRSAQAALEPHSVKPLLTLLRPGREFLLAVPAGTLIFLSAFLQQAGLSDSTAGKAAFITAFYLILVPIAGLFLGHKASGAVWAGSLLAMAGLYFLCITQDFRISSGDFLIFIGSFFWAAHILYIDRVSKNTNAFVFCMWQFLVCALLNLVFMLFFETFTLQSIRMAWLALLFGGIFSSGVAYTLQFMGQKHALPAHAAIIMSTESIFAALGGFLLLSETMTSRAMFGCVLMLFGMLLSQLPSLKSNSSAPS